MTLGERIRLARERLKLTQKQVGEVFGISDKAVSAWERDENRPEYEKLPRLRQVLRVPYFWLMEAHGEPPPPDDIHNEMEDLSPIERATVSALIQQLRTLRPPEQPVKHRLTRK